MNCNTGLHPVVPGGFQPQGFEEYCMNICFNDILKKGLGYKPNPPTAYKAM